MYSLIGFLICALFHLTVTVPRMNLYFTDDFDVHNDSNIVFEYDCSLIPVPMERDDKVYQIISYCLTEWPPEWVIEENNLDQNLTFTELYKQKISSEQLYSWSAPLDIVERYEFYLNDLSNTDQSSELAAQVFYNCTLPRFGTSCQYSLDSQAFRSDNGTLSDVVHQFYQQEYNPTTLTCYMHLACHQGSASICLDWSEICDGIADCQGGIDEEWCWQFASSDCSQDEYQCTNGQCVSKTFLHDGSDSFECLDMTDEMLKTITNIFVLSNVAYGEPAIRTEDVICPMRYDILHRKVKLTSSCLPERNQLLEQLLFDAPPAFISYDCWIAVICQLDIVQLPNQQCYSHCPDGICDDIINETCPDLVNVPSGAIVFGHVFFLYAKDDLLAPTFRLLPPRYVCYNEQLCTRLSPNKSSISFGNSTCRRPADLPLVFNRPDPRRHWLRTYVIPLYEQLSQCNEIRLDYPSVCNNVTMYRCMNSSKCISKHHLCNQVKDCDYHDDEQCSPINGSCLLYGLNNLFKCEFENLCISPALVQDRVCHCHTSDSFFCEDESLELSYSRKRISFATTCDGFVELEPLLINGQYETDETECEHWQCNNTYTRCDGFWNCLNGADEIGCPSSSWAFNCSEKYQHICVSPITNQLMCLSLEKGNDGHIDCAGGTDEPKLCRSPGNHPNIENFYCQTDSGGRCVDHTTVCPFYNYQNNVHEQFCTSGQNLIQARNIAPEEYDGQPSAVKDFLCTRQIDTNKAKVKYFSLGKTTSSTAETAVSLSRQINTDPNEQRCHRGLPLQVWFDAKRNLSVDACLCPPSFYGSACQYQNQRVSLSLRMQTYAGSRRTLFALLVSLIDDTDEQLIHSHQQLTYLYIRDCQRKFNLYLLYSNRPKNQTKNYLIRIDVYEKVSFIYRGSYSIALSHSFLPVHRVAKEFHIPRSTDAVEHCSDDRCVHGQCTKYIGHPQGASFCRCSPHWSGKYCTIPYTSTCASGSHPTGRTVSNRSICMCPLHRWGSRCLLRNGICNSNQTLTCQNGGQCIPNDEPDASNKQFTCICRKGFSGERCETEDSSLLLSFHKDIILPQAMLIHFIRVMANAPHENGSTFKTILTHQNVVTVQWSRPFDIAFLDFFQRNYYLITVQQHHKSMSTIVRTIHPTDRCKHVSEVLNTSIMELHPLRRIKYYQQPCQQRSLLLSCFYDDTHICLCSDHDHQRLTNCLEFNHHSEYNCAGRSNCEHGAHCVQDRAACPQTSACMCPKCFYGALCQFSSNLFDLSLDVILGYHIQPGAPLLSQPSIVQFSMVLISILVLFGMINNVLTTITFTNKDLRITASGIYLLSSSVISLFTLVIFALKYWILIIAQMTYITNRSFLSFQCISIDFLLRVGVNLDQWLSSLVGVDRASMVIKGTNFDKKASLKMAKYCIFLCILLTTSTAIHDPLHRYLLDEDADDIKEKRIWCTLKFSKSLRTFNLFIVMFHFFLPFFINVISALVIIIMTTRQKTTVHKEQSYETVLRTQLKQHNHLLISPSLLVILALPRLIISFVGGCMKSTSSSWLFLIGYLISFAPSMLSFFVFILPSQSYKQVLRKTIDQHRQIIRARLHLRV